VLQASHCTDGCEAIQHSLLRCCALEGPQFGHGVTAIGDHERMTLTNPLEVSAEPCLQFASADGSVSWHVVMMTTSDTLVKSAPGLVVSHCVSGF
jgi:hypothetical protein